MMQTRVTARKRREDNRVLAIRVFVMDRNTEAAFSNDDAPDLSTMHLRDAVQ